MGDVTSRKPLNWVNLRKSLQNFRDFKNQPMQLMEDGLAAHGPYFEMTIFHQLFGVVSCPEMAEQIMASQEANYGRFSKVLKPLIGDAMLAVDGELWKKKRRLSQPFFHPKEIGKTRQILVSQIERAISEYSQVHRDEPWNVNHLMQRLTLAVVSKVFLKQDVWTLDPKVLAAIDQLFVLVKKRVTNAFAPPMWIPTPGNLSFRRSMNEIYKVIDQMVSGQHNQGDDGILIDRLIQAEDDESGYRLTKQDVRDEVIQYFFAGHETTATLLSFVLDYLAWNPAWQDELRAELDELDEDYPSLKDLSKLKRLNWTLQETLRLRPSAWFLIRQAKVDHVLKSGAMRYPIPAGTMMLISVWNIHHRADLWSEPHRFHPLRMEHLKDQPRNAYMPFGIGKTTCIGNNFAIFEASLILSKLLRHFVFKPIADKPASVEAGITLRPSGDIELQVLARKPNHQPLKVSG